MAVLGRNPPLPLVNDSMLRDRVLGLLGILGSLCGIALSIAFFATGWGDPGTAAYRAYELLNRLMSITLFLMAGSWLGLALSMPRGYGRAGAWLAFVASLAMMGGNAAEFWLFTDLPYGDPTNARSISWSIYLFGSLIQTIGATAAGIFGLRAGLWPMLGTYLLVLALPIEIFSFISGGPFIGPAVLALVAGRIVMLSPAISLIAAENPASN